ncbi:hypothetical protein LX36DRAFT_284524 [Colletotrichum falcatum]|nr:hypothetical protein LX36DRAFT_284524 [Colletotrichum falcatum]
MVPPSPFPRPMNRDADALRCDRPLPSSPKRNPARRLRCLGMTVVCFNERRGALRLGEHSSHLHALGPAVPACLQVVRRKIIGIRCLFFYYIYTKTSYDIHLGRPLSSFVISHDSSIGGGGVPLPAGLKTATVQAGSVRRRWCSDEQASILIDFCSRK